MKPLRTILATVLISAISWGCSENNDSTSRIGTGDSENTSSLRAVHLSPDAPAVDIAVQGSRVLEGVTYRQASGFLAVPPGDASIGVLVAGTDTAVIDASLPLEADTRYTVLAINTVENIEPLVISDNNEAPAGGFSALRVVHGAPAAPAVDVYVSAPEDAFDGLAPLLEGVPFKAVSDELQVPAGDYRVRVTGAGDSAVIYDSGTLSLAAGVEYIAVASQVSAGLSPIGLTVLTDLESTPVALVDDTRARVRAVHASADAPEVDISVNGNAVLQNVPFGVGSGYLELPSGTYNIDVAASASGSSVINADLTFSAGTDTTIAAVNSLAQIEPLVLMDDNSAPADGQIKVRLVHAAPSAGPVDIYITAPHADLHAASPVIEDFLFKSDTGYLEVPAGDYQVRVTVADTSTVAIDTGAISFAAGSISTAFALDPAHAGGDFGVLLLTDSE